MILLLVSHHLINVPGKPPSPANACPFIDCKASFKNEEIQLQEIAPHDKALFFVKYEEG